MCCIYMYIVHVLYMYMYLLEIPALSDTNKQMDDIHVHVHVHVYVHVHLFRVCGKAAVKLLPCHFPLKTVPKEPDPIFSSIIISLYGISHSSVLSRCIFWREKRERERERGGE